MDEWLDRVDKREDHIEQLVKEQSATFTVARRKLVDGMMQDH